MKKVITLLALALLLVACSSRGPRNAYIGCIPKIMEEEHEAYVKWKKHPSGNGSWNSVGAPKYTKLIDKEYKELEGVKMPCRSIIPEFSVIENTAVFMDGKYAVLLQFNKSVRVTDLLGTLCLDVMFVNEAEHIAYGQTTQLASIGREGRGEGEVMLFEFYLKSTHFGEASETQEKVDGCILQLAGNDNMYSTDKKEGWSPESSALYYQEGFYKAIVENDAEAFDELDYGFAETDFSSEYDATHFGKAYDLWKRIFPDKWKVIKEYRQKLIKAGNVLCTLDTEDPR